MLATVDAGTTGSAVALDDEDDLSVRFTRSNDEGSLDYVLLVHEPTEEPAAR